MKRLLQILTTAVAGALLMGGVAGANSSYCTIYTSGSTSYNSCQNNQSNTSVQVVCENDTYVINNNSQQAGTGNATYTKNSSGGYTASGSATNQNGTTVTIGSSCGQAAAPTSTTSPSSPSSSTSTAKKSSSTPSSTAVAAASLPETGSNTVVDTAIIGTALVVGGLVISTVGTALYRRAALKQE